MTAVPRHHLPTAVAPDPDIGQQERAAPVLTSDGRLLPVTRPHHGHVAVPLDVELIEGIGRDDVGWEGSQPLAPRQETSGRDDEHVLVAQEFRAGRLIATGDGFGPRMFGPRHFVLNRPSSVRWTSWHPLPLMLRASIRIASYHLIGRATLEDISPTMPGGHLRAAATTDTIGLSENRQS